MKIGLLPSTQWGNAVLGGGSEAQYCQDIARRMKPLLEEHGHRVMIFAGSSDANSDGARALVYWGAGLALSIHSDAGYDSDSHWAALMCWQEERSRPWWTAVMETYCASMRFTWDAQRVSGYRNRGYQRRTPGVNGVAVIRIPEAVGIPTCLIEANWHDRKPDAEAERSPVWRELAAESLVRGVLTYLGQAGPLPAVEGREEATMYCPTFELPMEGAYHCYSIPDLFNSLPQFQAAFPWLVLHNPYPQDADVFVWVTRDNGTISLVNGGAPETAGATFRQKVPKWSRVAVEMGQYISRDGYIGGCSLTVKSRTPIVATGQTLAKWK